MKNNISLENLDSLFPVSFNEEQLSRAKTIFLRNYLSYHIDIIMERYK